MKNKLLLIIIFALAIFLRFYNLGTTPALNADEAALGYNAYSLIQTGKDEHGNSWPIHFQSFNDYKPGLYVYMIIPFVKVFGLNEWSVRFPGAFIGALSVIIVYLLGNRLSKNEQLDFHGIKFGNFAALLLAISPWHIHFSRGGWEVNVATFFISLGILLFVKFTEYEKRKDLLFSALSLILAFYTYHAARVVIIFLGLGVLLIYKNIFFRNFRKIIPVIIISVILLMPLARDLVRPEVSSRASGVGLFADKGPIARVDEQRNEHASIVSLNSKILHNKAVNYLLRFSSNWADHYHGLFLFLSGDDIQRNKVPETGQMYTIDLLFLIVGIIYLVRNINISNELKLIYWWVLVAPLASALTFQTPHALRSHNMVIPFILILAIGLVQILKIISTQFKGNVFRFAGYLLLIFFIATQFARYEHMYWVHMVKEYPYSSQYGVKELYAYVNSLDEKYDNIVITDRYDQPYILYLFYNKYSPAKFQSGHSLTERDGFGFSTVRKIDNFTFTSLGNWKETINMYPNSLLIGTGEEVPGSDKIVKDIYGTNNFKYFRVYQNK